MIDKEILEVIYEYYPKKCKYSTIEYQNSREFKKYIQKIKYNSEYMNVYKELKHIFKQYYIKIWSANDEPGKHISVLFHKNHDILDDDVELIKKLGGKRLNLEIYISKLVKVYYIYMQETIYKDGKWSFFNYDYNYYMEDSLKKKLNKTMQYLGYKELLKNDVNSIVWDIETECHYTNEVKVFHCLFSDLENNI